VRRLRSGWNPAARAATPYNTLSRFPPKRHSGVCCLAVDEAHCVSEWGHDFRKEFRELGSLRAALPGVPFVALTATATGRVRQDIAASLRLRAPHAALASFDRPNIVYAARQGTATADVAALVRAELAASASGSGSVIVYCLTRDGVESTASALSAAGVPGVRHYHGALAVGARDAAHGAFADDSCRVIVATVAFGMGIDKKDVRHVIHCGAPKSLEAYYQESGRAGRDGLPAKATLLWSAQDFTRADFYTRDVASAQQREAVVQAMGAMRSYAAAPGCRRAALLAHFGEPPCADDAPARDAATCCDNCSRGGAQRDMAEDARLLLGAVEQTRGTFGAGVPIAVLRGGRGQDVTKPGREFHIKAAVYGKGRARSERWWRALFDLLLASGLLAPRALAGAGGGGGGGRGGGAGTVYELSPAGRACLQAQGAVMLPVSQELLAEESGGGGGGGGRGGAGGAPAGDGGNPALAAALRAWRSARAAAEGKPAYVYLTDAMLAALCAAAPQSLAALRAVPGFGPARADQFGAALLDIVAQHPAPEGGAGADADGAGAAAAAAGGASAAGGTGRLSDAERALHDELLAWRGAAATRLRARPEHLLGGPALLRLAAERPAAAEGTHGLRSVEGVNDFVLRTVGAELLRAIADGAQRHGLALDAGAAAAARRAAEAHARLAAANAAAAAMHGGGGGGGGVPVAPGAVTGALGRLGCAARAAAGVGPLGPAATASLEAWRAGETPERIAAGRRDSTGAPKPILPGSVLSHLLDAARTGAALDWGRLAADAGLGTPGMFSPRQLAAAVATATAAAGGAELKLRDVRAALPEAQADALDAARKGAVWDAIRFAIAARDCGVDLAAAEEEAAPEAEAGAEADAEAELSGKRPREEPAADAGAAPGGGVRAAALALLAARGGATRAELAAAVGEAGLDAALADAALEGEIYYDRGGRYLPL
jgi:RecQ family ATP-dependent DNA helicase